MTQQSGESGHVFTSTVIIHKSYKNSNSCFKCYFQNLYFSLFKYKLKLPSLKQLDYPPKTLTAQHLGIFKSYFS